MVGVGMVGRRLVQLLALALAALVSARAFAQAGFDVQQLRPVPGQSLGYFNLQSAEILGHGVWEAGLLTHFADDPLVMRGPYGERVAAVVGRQLTLDLLGAVGILDVLDLGLGVPVVLAQRGEPAPTIPGASATDVGFGLGDVRLLGRGRLLSTARRHALVGVVLGLSLELSLPTGDEKAYQGEGPRFEPRLLLDVVLPRGHRMSLNFGYRARPERTIGRLEIDDTLTFGLASTVRLAPRWRALAEVVGEVSVLADAIDPEETPLEVLIGAKATPLDALLVTFGGGMALTEGFGSADYRLFVGVSFLGLRAQDEDGDGIEGDDDRCPDAAEDRDGHLDGDGCPDPDNDGDTLVDGVDTCPLESEDFDRREDADGCPDPDNDGDGVVDGEDRCPLRPGPAPDGCP